MKYRFEPLNEGQGMNLVSIQQASKTAALARASHQATTLQGLYPDAGISVRVVSLTCFNKTPPADPAYGIIALPDGRFIDEKTGEEPNL